MDRISCENSIFVLLFLKISEPDNVFWNYSLKGDKKSINLLSKRVNE